MAASGYGARQGPRGLAKIGETTLPGYDKRPWHPARDGKESRGVLSPELHPGITSSVGSKSRRAVGRKGEEG